MANALDTLAKMMSLKEQQLRLGKTALSLAEAQRKQQEAQRTQDIKTQEEQNRRVKAYFQNYDDTQRMEEEFGADPQIISAKNNAEKQLRASLTVPLNIAMANQYRNEPGSGQIAKASTESARIILENEGLIDNDTGDRLEWQMLKNTAMTKGVELPEMNSGDVARDMVKSYYNVDLTEEDVDIQDTTTLLGKQNRFFQEALQTYNTLTKRSGFTPEQRIVMAVSTAMGNTDVYEQSSPNEALYITQKTMQTLSQRQMVRLEGALAQLPALERQYEESAAVVLQDFMGHMKTQGKDISYSNLMQNIGEYEMLKAFSYPDNISEAYGRVNESIRKVNTEYDKLPPAERFRLYLNTLVDYAMSNVNTGSTARDQASLGMLSKLRQASDVGKVSAFYPGLYPYLAEGFQDFEEVHNKVLVERNNQMQTRANAGLMSAVRADGKLMSWKPANESFMTEKARSVFNDPAIFDFLQSSKRVTREADGNYSLDVGDLNIEVLDQYRQAYNTGGKVRNLVLSESPDGAQLTLNDLPDTNLAAYTEWMNDSVNRLQLARDAKDKKRKSGLRTSDIEGLEFNGIPIGKTIAQYPELVSIVKASLSDPNKLQSVLNTGLAMHYKAVDGAALRTMQAQESYVYDDLYESLPAFMRADLEADVQTRGALNVVDDNLSMLSDNLDYAYEQYREAQEAVRTAPRAAGGVGIVPGLAGSVSEDVMKYYDNTKQEYLRQVRKLSTLRKSLKGYTKDVSTKEVAKLEEAFGVIPPRVEAIVLKAGDLQKRVEEILNSYKD